MSASHDASTDATSPAPLETTPNRRASQRTRVGLNLFWRTFFLLALLLVGSILAWLQTLRALEFEPRTLQTAQQIASLVNLSRAALVHADAIARVSLIKTMADQEGVRILPREPSDRFDLVDDTALGVRLTEELTERLGPGTIVAGSVNGESGLWVGFTINGDPNWLLMDRSRLSTAGGKTWLIWLITAAALSLAGAAAIARLINRPLKQLSYAANRVRDGDFAASQLDEEVVTSEIREVNIGFNRMAQKLAKLEQDRAVMLAGISHDLRTPLARLRLETEMSVIDDVAREHMVADIVQLDATIDKFLDYARPDHVTLTPVNLHGVVSSCVYAVQDHRELQISMSVPEDLIVLADEVELARVISNLLENARRYGKTPESGTASVEIAAKGREKWVLVKVRDHGPGVPPDQLSNLTKPFFRGNSARTAAAGAGLGLAIVDKTVQRMGGIFALANSGSGGLVAHIQLQRASQLPAGKDPKQRLQRPQIKRQLPPDAAKGGKPVKPAKA
ncbi:integral membrane sensor signal transduction histidine kinase [Paracidovorax avenae ATCC 19860]|uniref:histidine kinase n=1 Tax=Paracidovorax avenae (strain ATCC 19860 / DSM 7227 / CCUG 15838 / JCM 20985 / LMG 2117 / NCPPB 1011) TaxID=643561 RepID=F0Q4P7_PARA1|nr:sensor histidine kinase [Paracidovorax avenae]ADX45551.1 integral membrane sensor signal transduction histidine kinase [Paracidovorax avenae ATCC 19860]AVT02280.1 HAMP domain-containing protein [Paracidovorax avenae]